MENVLIQVNIEKKKKKLVKFTYKRCILESVFIGILTYFYSRTSSPTEQGRHWLQQAALHGVNAATERLEALNLAG